MCVGKEWNYYAKYNCDYRPTDVTPTLYISVDSEAWLAEEYLKST